MYNKNQLQKRQSCFTASASGIVLLCLLIFFIFPITFLALTVYLKVILYTFLISVCTAKMTLMLECVNSDVLSLHDNEVQKNI